MRQRKLATLSIAAILAAQVVPSSSPAVQAVAATKAGVQSDACAAGAAMEEPEPSAGGTHSATGDVVPAPGDAARAGAVRGKPGAIADGRLVILDADTGAFGIEGKNGLFRAPKGTDLATIGGKDVRVYANANGEVSAIEIVTGEATRLDAKPSEPVQN